MSSPSDSPEIKVYSRRISVASEPVIILLLSISPSMSGATVVTVVVAAVCFAVVVVFFVVVVVFFVVVVDFFVVVVDFFVVVVVFFFVVDVVFEADALSASMTAAYEISFADSSA